MPKITVPIIHPNGTSRKELLDLRENAYAALEHALDALKRMTPNGRDYYPAGPCLLNGALLQHQRRLQAVHGIMEELEEECRQINEA